MCSRWFKSRRLRRRSAAYSLVIVLVPVTKGKNGDCPDSAAQAVPMNIGIPAFVVDSVRSENGDSPNFRRLLLSSEGSVILKALRSHCERRAFLLSRVSQMATLCHPSC